MTDYPPQALTNAAVAAAKAYDLAHRFDAGQPDVRSWTAVPDDQVGRLLAGAAPLIEAAARQEGVEEGADRSAAWLAGPDGAQALAELAGKLVTDAVAAERDRIRQLAVERHARYDERQPCGCGRTWPPGSARHGEQCSYVTRAGLPFADLLGGES